jgi:hypothetical protein
MSNVVSLCAVRAQRELSFVPISTEQLSEKIDAVAHQFVSAQAVVLLRQILRFSREGRTELSYQFLCSELRVSDRSLTKYIEELEVHCFIKVRRSRVSKVLATNQFEIDFKGPLGASMPALKTPRYDRKGGTVKNTVRGEGVPEKVRSNTISTNDKKLIPNRNQRVPAQSFDSISDAIEHTTKRIVRKRTEKVAKATKPGAQLTLAGVKATWAASMLKHYPKVPPVMFTSKEFALFKLRIAPILSAANLSEFFDYTVASWNSLRETKFKWLRAKGKDVAVSPSLLELMRFWKIFAQSFSDSRMAEVVNAGKLKRTEVDALEDKVLTQASEIAKTREEVARLRKQLARAEQLASAPIPDTKPRMSLSERRRVAEKNYNDGSHDIPKWK